MEQNRGRHARHAAPTPSQLPQINFNSQQRNANNHSNGNSHSQTYTRVRKKRRRKNKALKIVGITAAVIIAIALCVGGAFAFYMNSLNQKMALKDDLSMVLQDKKGEAFYTLVIGSDNWETFGARSDAMALVRIDLPSAQMTIVSIPRDTPYTIGSRTVKMNQVYAEEGPQGAVLAVSQLTSVNISHFVEIEFDQLESVVDSLGGIWVDVPQAIDYTVYTLDRPTVHIDAGRQLINGEQAVALARMRTAYGNEISQDALRQKNIRAMMVGIMDKALSAPITEIPGIIQNIASLLSTDISVSDFVTWAQSLAKAGKGMTVYSCTGPEEGAISDDPSAQGAWLTYEAPEEWAKLMKVVDKGDDPTHVLDDSKNVVSGLSTTTVIEGSSEGDSE